MSFVILINPKRVCYPPSEYDFTGEELSPPLGLLSLAAVLRERGHTVAVYDSQIGMERAEMNTSATSLHEYEALISECPTSERLVVGISCVFPGRNEARDYIQRTFARRPDAFVVVGGPDATFAPEEYLIEGGAHIAVLGEGEKSFPSLIENLENPGSVKGIAFRGQDGRTHENDRETPIDIDTLPFPARELLDLRKYHPTTTSMISSRGCRYNCSFCSSSLFWGDFRTRSALHVAEEIERIYKQFGFSRIRHQDDNWADRDEQFFHQLQDELYRRDLIGPLEHEIETSPTSLLGNSKVSLFAEIGVRTVWMGMETADDVLRMNYLKKPYSYEQILKAATLLKQKGIKFGLFLIFGSPAETYEDAIKTIEMADALEPSYVGASILTRYPGTKIDREEPHGQVREALFSQLVGWGHSGEFLGRKMSIDDLLQVFAYAYKTFGHRLGNWYNLGPLFRMPNSADKLIQQLRTAQIHKECIRVWGELEGLIDETSGTAKAALLVEAQQTLDEIVSEDQDSPSKTFLLAKRQSLVKPRTVEVPPVRSHIKETRVISLAIKSIRIVVGGVISLAGIGIAIATARLVPLENPVSRMLYVISICLLAPAAWVFCISLSKVWRAIRISNELAMDMAKETLEEYCTRKYLGILELLESRMGSRGMRFHRYEQRETGRFVYQVRPEGAPVSEITVEAIRHSGPEFDSSLIDPLFDLYQITVVARFRPPAMRARFLAQRSEGIRFVRRDTDKAEIRLKKSKLMPWATRDVYVTESDIVLLEKAIVNCALPFLEE